METRRENNAKIYHAKYLGENCCENTSLLTQRYYRVIYVWYCWYVQVDYQLSIVDYHIINCYYQLLSIIHMCFICVQVN